MTDFDETFVDAITKHVHPEPTEFKIDDRRKVVYSDGVPTIYETAYEAEPKALKFSTLSAVRDWYPKVLTLDSDQIVVVVEDPATVKIVAPVVYDLRQQFTYGVATAVLPRIVFGQYLDTETFNIQLQSMFVQSPERDALLKFIGVLRSVKEKETSDDGVSQQVTIQAGVTRVGGAVAQPIWNLVPFRTFPEVPQPSSNFLLRLGSGSDGSPKVALFEADGGAWRRDAIELVAGWLRAALGEDATILA